MATNHHNTATSHVSIDMQPLNHPSVAPARGTEQTASAVVAAQANRSRSRSRSQSTGRRTSRSPRPDTPLNSSARNQTLVNNDLDPLLPTGAEADAEMIPRKRPTIVVPESLDDDDDPRLPNTPQQHPGVDDGFITSNDEAADSDIDADDRPDGPKLTPRMGGDSDDGSRSNRGNGGSFPAARRPSFPPSFVPGLDGTVIIPDVNVYQQKKTLAQGMMDLALLSANANQLRYVLESNRSHPYFYVSLTFISISIILQVAVGVGLIWNSRYNVKNDADICKADRINNFTVIGVFLITTVNVFITSFGVAALEQPVIRQ